MHIANQRTKPKPWYSFGDWLWERFDVKVSKVALDAGHTCPNIDGSVAKGGCTFCDQRSFNPQAEVHEQRKSLGNQLLAGKHILSTLFRAKKYIAYFQAYSNTYTSIDYLKEMIDSVDSDPDVVGFSFGTRPDCIDEKRLDILEDLARRKVVWIEYGLQSCHDKTLEIINRGHDYACFERAVEFTKSRGIFICAHLILGLPGEDREMMFETMDRVAGLDVDGIKLHHLYVSPGTKMAEDYRRGEIELMDAEEYVDLAVSCLERIPQDVCVHRLVGDTETEYLLAPIWPMTKQEVLGMIEEEFRRRGSWQGKWHHQNKVYPRVGKSPLPELYPPRDNRYVKKL
ncbi:MAG: TIGR01212 family radical SAM protein [Planctomycetes bacterium]|nr:TIGR01212 family radical SAM protein [Planctomycetota bacterium]